MLMKKKLLLLLPALLAAMSLQAQVELSYTSGIDAGWGDAGMMATPYVSFPKDYMEPYQGNSITKIYIGLGKNATNSYLYFKEKADDEQYIYREKLGDLKAGWNEITLETPFEIQKGKPLAIGYRASFAEAGGVGIGSEIWTDAEKVYLNNKNSWKSCGGSVAICAVVEGESLPVDAMMLASKIYDLQPDLETTEATYTVKVRNMGANPISSYQLAYSLDGDTKVLLVHAPLAVNATGQASFTVPCVEKGTHKVTVAIKSVNGKDCNFKANQEISANIKVLDHAFLRRVVCEEFSGTWCGFCPRGMVGMDRMSKKYPGRFLPVSAHGGDRLEIETDSISYADFIDACPGAPYSNVNRRFKGDPFNDIQNMFDLEAASENHIAFELREAQWDADRNFIDLKAVYYSDIDIASPQYHISYTVTEDGVTGYSQANYFSGTANELDGWENKSNPTDDFEFNDLARAIFGGYHGTPARYSDMIANEEYTHTYRIRIPDNVRDKNNIKITGQIIDHKTGFIVNADRKVPTLPQGVGSVSGDIDCRVMARGGEIEVESVAGAVVSVYDISGRMVASSSLPAGTGSFALAEGMYIVKVTDGRSALTLKIIL